MAKWNLGADLDALIGIQADQRRTRLYPFALSHMQGSNAAIKGRVDLTAGQIQIGLVAGGAGAADIAVEPAQVVLVIAHRQLPGFQTELLPGQPLTGLIELGLGGQIGLPQPFQPGDILLRQLGQLLLQRQRLAVALVSFAGGGFLRFCLCQRGLGLGPCQCRLARIKLEDQVALADPVTGQRYGFLHQRHHRGGQGRAGR